MVRNPYMRSNNNNRNNRFPPPPKPPQQTTGNTLPPLLENTSFSPQLSLLLSMILKDGLARNTTMEILRNIYPYADPPDKAMIDRLFDVKEFAGSYRPSQNQSPFPGKALSKQERDLNMLRIFKQYASLDTVRVFERMEQTIAMQAEMTRMFNRVNSLRNMNMSNPDELLNTMEMFMPAQERKNMRNMTNMMNLFKNMNNINPEDLMKMWGSMAK